jgi:hypothetical protein
MRTFGQLFSTALSGRRLFLLAALPLAFGTSLGAQSNLSTQGFGYPPGQLSTRATGTGGAIGELDPWSPLNPAAVGALASRMLYFQIEPEYRTVSLGGAVDLTTTARFPLVFGALPVGRGWVVTVGSSTLLDRSASTTVPGQQVINGQTVDLTTKIAITGAINDVRLAAAWTPRPWLRAGAGLHAFTGRNLINVSQTFADTIAFAGFANQQNLSISGGAVSGGVELMSSVVTGTVAYRHGGTMHSSVGDTTIGTANVPSRVGASLAFTGIPNSTIAVRASHEDWSALNNLAGASFHANDAWDESIGADVAGPRLGARRLMLRGGFRNRTLPFEAAGEEVTERSASAGMGTLFANGRVVGDFALIRAWRDAGLPATEKSWTMSFGFTVRP